MTRHEFQRLPEDAGPLELQAIKREPRLFAVTARELPERIRAAVLFDGRPDLAGSLGVPRAGYQRATRDEQKRATGSLDRPVKLLIFF